ncbi:Ribonuclease T2 [Schistosoma japonicum]|nr:Ribonuclease T2 [Schistosoma japonicum]
MHSISMISIVLIFISILNVGYTNSTRNWDYFQLILVWPPSYCSYNSRVKAKLEEKWPNLTDYTNSEGLWESEWNHHGRCALQARSTPILKCIPFDGKRPNYEYASPRDKFVQIQIFPETIRNRTQFYQLNEVIFCYNSKLQLINCPELIDEYQECNNGFIFKEFNDSSDNDDNHRDDDDDDDDDKNNKDDIDDDDDKD